MVNENTLQRFLDAQQSVYKTALEEIKSGRKRSHWMWYMFPQVKGLGFSETSRFYGINGLAEAGEYLNHPILGSRLIGTCTALLHLQSDDAQLIFGSPDDLKLKSSMTLFLAVTGADPVFDGVLQKFFKGEKDDKTLEILMSK